MMIEKINEQVKKCPSTVFDSFDLKTDLRKSGAGLREALVNLTNLYGTISQLASNALLLYKKAEARRDKIESLAWDKVPAGKVTQQKIAVRTVKVMVDGKETTLNEEDELLVVYEYINNRGKDKMKEISTLLDVGRTLLSWDKNEMSQTR